MTRGLLISVLCLGWVGGCASVPSPVDEAEKRRVSGIWQVMPDDQGDYHLSGQWGSEATIRLAATGEYTRFRRGPGDEKAERVAVGRWSVKGGRLVVVEDHPTSEWDLGGTWGTDFEVAGGNLRLKDPNLDRFNTWRRIETAPEPARPPLLSVFPLRSTGGVGALTPAAVNRFAGTWEIQDSHAVYRHSIFVFSTDGTYSRYVRDSAEGVADRPRRVSYGEWSASDDVLRLVEQHPVPGWDEPIEFDFDLTVNGEILSFRDPESLEISSWKKTEWTPGPIPRDAMLRIPRNYLAGEHTIALLPAKRSAYPGEIVSVKVELTNSGATSDWVPVRLEDVAGLYFARSSNPRRIVDPGLPGWRLCVPLPPGSSAGYEAAVTIPADMHPGDKLTLFLAGTEMEGRPGPEDATIEIIARP